MRHDGRKPVVVLAYREDASKDKDAATRQCKRILLGIADDVHGPLRGRRMRRTLRVQLLARLDDAVRDTAHTHAVRRRRREQLALVLPHGLFVRLVAHAQLLRDADVHKAPAPGRRHLRQVEDVVDACPPCHDHDQHEAGVRLRRALSLRRGTLRRVRLVRLLPRDPAHRLVPILLMLRALLLELLFGALAKQLGKELALRLGPPRILPRDDPCTMERWAQWCASPHTAHGCAAYAAQ